MRLTSSRLWGKLLPPERKEEGALQRKKREGGGSPLHPGLSSLGGRARPVRPRPAARAAIQAVIRVGRLSVVAVGRQCLNVLVFLPELLFGASEQATVETSRPGPTQPPKCDTLKRGSDGPTARATRRTLPPLIHSCSTPQSWTTNQLS